MMSRFIGEAEPDNIFGLSSVTNALLAKRRDMYHAYIIDNWDTKPETRDVLGHIIEYVNSEGVPVSFVSKGKLHSLSGNRPHQGVVLAASPLEYTPIRELEPWSSGGRPPLWVALDQVQDPMNLGAVLRSAYFLGADGVVTCRRNSCPLTPTVSRASAGAAEQMTVHDANNIPDFLKRSSDNGWIILGTHLTKGVSCNEYEMEQPTILIMGSEGKGLRTNITRLCHDNITIQRRINEVSLDNSSTNGERLKLLAGGTEQALLQRGRVDSLNISVAAGIFINTLLGSAVSNS
eukprot:CFRG3323T1